MQREECSKILKTLGRFEKEKVMTIADFGKPATPQKPGKRFSPFYITGMQ